MHFFNPPLFSLRFFYSVDAHVSEDINSEINAYWPTDPKPTQESVLDNLWNFHPSSGFFVYVTGGLKKMKGRETKPFPLPF